MRNIDNNINQVQKEIGILASIVGIIVTSANLLEGMIELTLLESMQNSGVWAVALPTILIMFTCFFYSKISRIIQVIIVILVASLSIWEDYNSIYGLGLFFLGILLSFKYGFLKKDLILKSVIILFILTGVVCASTMYSTEVMTRAWLYGLTSLFYLGLFFGVCYIIYKNEIAHYLNQIKNDETAIQSLSNQKAKLVSEINSMTKDLKKLENEYSALIAPVDLDEKGLTIREKELVRNLIKHRETEKELAERLNIKVNTIKSHFYKIRKKLGVERREDLIELCRNNIGEV